MRGKLQSAGKVRLIKKSLALCQTLFACMQLILQILLQQIILAPAFAFPAVNKYQRTQAFIKAHGKPYAHQAPAKVQAKESHTPTRPQPRCRPKNHAPSVATLHIETSPVVTGHLISPAACKLITITMFTARPASKNTSIKKMCRPSSSTSGLSVKMP